MKHPLKHPIGPLAAALLLLLWTALSAEEPKYRSPNHLVVSPDGRFAYAVNQTADSISVLDIRARTAIDEMPVGPRPSHADISPDGRLLYVSNQYGDRVEVVNLKDRRVVRALEAEHEPYGVTLSPDGKKLYVAESISDTVSIFDTRNGKRLSRAHSGRGPRFIARTSDGSKLLVSNGMSRVDLRGGVRETPGDPRVRERGPAAPDHPLLRREMGVRRALDIARRASPDPARARPHPLQRRLRAGSRPPGPPGDVVPGQASRRSRQPMGSGGLAGWEPALRDARRCS